MATTRIADVVVPEVFIDYMMKDTKTKSNIFRSGILRADDNMSGLLTGGGRTANVPFWKDLDDDESNLGSDDPADDKSPKKLASGKDIAARQVRTQGWSSTQLSGILAGSDPLAHIRNRVSDYWVRQFQKHLVATLRGLFADNIANDAGDMVNPIANDSASAITAAELISAEAILDTAQTMGDAKKDLTMLLMHSVVYTRLAKQNLIDFIPDSEGKVLFPTYLGYNVIEDDGCPAIAGTNRVTYSTYLVGRDALCFNEVPVPDPVGIDKDESLAGGMGVEELWTRRQYVMHPYGIKWTDSSVSGDFPTYAELQNAANWDRVYAERKQIPMALLKTNG